MYRSTHICIYIPAFIMTDIIKHWIKLHGREYEQMISHQITLTDEN